MFKSQNRFVAALMWVILLGACFLFFSSCDKELPAPEKVENIVRIFMHEPGRYSFMIQLSDSDVVTMRTFRLFNCETRFILDVPQDEKMWAYIQEKGKGPEYRTFVDLHIHSVRDMEGAGWDHGKFGRGQTHIIQ